MTDGTHTASPLLTKRTQAALHYAEEEETTLHLPNVGAACLLLGLLREEQNVAARVLRDIPGFPASLDPLRLALHPLADHPTIGIRTDAGLSFEQVVARILSAASTIAEQLGHHYTGTEHLLLGMLNTERNSATEVLDSIGVSTDAVRQALFAVLRIKLS